MMHSNEMRKQVEKLEHSLNPRQAMILAVDNAIARFNSPQDCDDWLGQHPDDRLLGDPRQVLAGFGKRLKKEKPVAAIKSIGSELAGRAALARLWVDSIYYVGEVTEGAPLRLAQIADRNSQVMEQIELRRKVLAALNVIAVQPYPLDCQDAAAIEATTAHQVQSWETFLTDFCDWYSKDKATDPAPDIIVAFEDAVRALIKAGEVEGGSAVELGPIPMESLLLAPLLYGEWIDRHVVELAEFGAMVKAKGFISRVSDRHHLAPLLICQSGEGGQLVAADEMVIDQLCQAAKAALVGFTGRTMEIEGRPYLNIDDYRAWPGRKLEGDLQVVAGIIVPSWNRLVDRRGGEGQAELAGTKVRHLMPLADRSDFMICSSLDELQRLRRQRALLMAKTNAMLATQVGLADFSYGDDLQRLLQDLFEADFTSAAISDRCFDGHQVLFNEQQRKLREQTAVAQELADSYNRLIDIAYRAQQTGGGPLKINIGDVRQAADSSAKGIFDSLIQNAKSEPRTAIAASERARRMFNPILKQLEDHLR